MYCESCIAFGQDENVAQTTRVIQGAPRELCYECLDLIESGELGTDSIPFDGAVIDE